MNLSIHMLREAVGHADARGDRVLYPKGWNGSADGEFAVYSVAMGYAQAIGEWPEEVQASVAVCREIVTALRAEGVEPTQSELETAVNNLAVLNELAAADAAAQAIPNAPLPPPEAEPIPNASSPPADPVPLAAKRKVKA